jgi:hypothetical protein
MEFHSEREEVLYTTLKQVLQNHLGTHRLGYHETLAACVPVLGYVLSILSESREEAPGLVETTVAELKQRTQARLRRVLRPLPSFQDDASYPPGSSPYQELGTALATFLTTAGIEHDMSVAATWRVMISLLADVLVMPLQDAGQTPADVEAYIDSLRDQLPAVMHMWEEERRPEHT